MLSSKKLEEIKSMLPLYSKKLLSKKDQDTIEAVLKQDQEMQKELNFWMMINKGYEKLKNEMPEPPKNIYSKIVANIENIEKENKQKFIFPNIFKLNPKISFALIMAEFLLIIGFIFYIFNLKYEYRTLSVNEIKADTSYKINVVFKEDIREKEIRELLTKINARIIDGPSKSGLYVLGIKDEKNKDYALDFLRKSDVVFLAEPVN